MATQNGSAPPYYASRPRISVDDQLRPELGDGFLLSLLVEETTMGLFRCEARFSNWGPQGEKTYLFFDRSLLDFGKRFAAELGPDASARRVFVGRITALEATYPPQRPPELTVLAEDRFQDLRMERRTRSFEEVSDQDIFEAVAAQHGLRAEVDVDGPTYASIAQLNQSDLAFLRERAVAVDAELWIDEETLNVQARTRRDAGNVTLTYGGNLLEFSVLADLAHQRSSVRVSGWSVSEKQAIDVEANSAILGAELNGHEGGSAILDASLAVRHERMVLDVPFTTEEARSVAQARYRARARQFVRGTAVVDGEARLRVGSTVTLQELGPLFNGSYYVTLVRHTFDLNDGFRTTIDVERPGIGRG